MTEVRSVPPREIILEARRDGESLETLQRVFSSSKIKIETVSDDPIRIRLPATTRAMEVLLLLLEELRPEGNIILDNGRSYAINDEGLSKLRRLVVRSLSRSEASSRSPQSQTSVAQVGSIEAMPNLESSRAATQPSDNSSSMSVGNDVSSTSASSAPTGFRSKQIALITVTFLAVVAISIGAATWLALDGKIGEVFVIFILGAAVIGAYSVVHRYASAFKQSVS